MIIVITFKAAYIFIYIFYDYFIRQKWQQLSAEQCA